MSTTAVVSEKGQVTLPKGMRDQLGIRPGSRLEFQVSDDGTLRVRVLARGADTLFGLLARAGEPSKSFEEMDAAVTESVKARARRSK
jgi:AbrB family looped-hinge helix DNA binding protein